MMSATYSSVLIDSDECRRFRSDMLSYCVAATDLSNMRRPRRRAPQCRAVEETGSHAPSPLCAVPGHPPCRTQRSSVPAVYAGSGGNLATWLDRFDFSAVRRRVLSA